MTFSEVNFDIFRTDIMRALQEVCDEYGCDIQLGKIKYGDTSATLDIDFLMRGEHGESGEQIRFNENCADYGFTPRDYKMLIRFEGLLYELIGFNPRARKYPCVLKEQHGDKMIKATPSAVRENKECFDLTF